jgi:hypothetical protein
MRKSEALTKLKQDSEEVKIKRQLMQYERVKRDQQYCKLLDAAKWNKPKPITGYVNTGDLFVKKYLGKMIKI